VPIPPLASERIAQWAALRDIVNEVGHLLLTTEQVWSDFQAFVAGVSDVGSLEEPARVGGDGAAAAARAGRLSAEQVASEHAREDGNLSTGTTPSRLWELMS
jgi:hypothetical protein